MRGVVCVLLVAGVGCDRQPEGPAGEPAGEPPPAVPTGPARGERPRPSPVFDIPVTHLWHKDTPNWDGKSAGTDTVVASERGKITRRMFATGEPSDDKARSMYAAFLTRLEGEFRRLDITVTQVEKGGVRPLDGGATHYRYQSAALRRNGVMRVALTRFNPDDEHDVRLIFSVARDDPQWKVFQDFVAGVRDRSQAFVLVGIEEVGW